MVEKAEWAADSTEEREEGQRAGLERCGARSGSRSSNVVFQRLNLALVSSELNINEPIFSYGSLNLRVKTIYFRSQVGSDEGGTKRSRDL